MSRKITFLLYVSLSLQGQIYDLLRKTNIISKKKVYFLAHEELRVNKIF